MRTPIKQNEVRLYPNSTTCPYRFNVSISNDWFSQEFVYKVHDNKVVFKRPTLESKKFPTRARKTGNSWTFFLTILDQDNLRLEIQDEDINEDQAILYL